MGFVFITKNRINLFDLEKSVPAKFARFVISALLLFVFGIGGAQAQEVTVASGGNAKTSSGSVSYSVGQVFYSTNTSANGSVAEGVQLPYEITAITGIEGSNKIKMKLLAFPNPVADHLTLKVNASSSPVIQSMEYRLYNVDGQLLDIQRLNSSATNIPMSNVAAGSYFLKVTKDNEAIQTFKIIKK